LEKVGREKFGVKELDDWYSVKAMDVSNSLSFIRFQHGSLQHTLKKLYPQHNWDPLRFSRVPSGYWADENAQRDALERFGREHLGVKELDDWYTVKTKKIVSELSFINKHYNGSLYSALKKLYPQHNWDPSRFSRVPNGCWTKSVQREALERFGKQIGIIELDDWHSVASKHASNELTFIKNYYNGSLYRALKTLYPQHHWNKDCFSAGVQLWTNENTQREALEKLGREKLGVQQLDDWYSVSTAVVTRELSFINNYYKGSLCDALMKLYPQHNWDPFRFSRESKTEISHREALEKLGREQFGVKDLDDWYSVTSTKAQNELSIISKYGSLIDALKKLYPHHDWDPLRFQRVPRGFWQQTDTVQHYHKMFIEWKKTYNIQTVNDWYLLPPHQVMQFKRVAQGIFGSKMKMLEEWFPDIVWHSQLVSQFVLQVIISMHYKLLTYLCSIC
jgi:hypothetical protein